VRNVTKARALLNCSSCGPDEGIFVGDVTVPATLTPAFLGVDTVAIAAGAGAGTPKKEEKAIEFTGVENQVRALVANVTSLRSLQVVLCSSMGTTNPNPPPFEGGSTLFWKLNAEAFLGFSGVPSAIVKPCGLGTGPGGQHTLGVGHDDELPGVEFTVNRADVAAVMAEAVVQRSAVRFLLCDKLLGRPTTDMAALLREAEWPWQQSARASSASPAEA